MVESFYFLFNLSRFYLLSGGKYAGFTKFKEEGYVFSTVFWGFNILGLASLLIGIGVVHWGMQDFSSFLSLPYVSVALPVLLFLSLPVDTYDLMYIERKRPHRLVRYTFIVILVQLSGLVSLLVAGCHMGHVLLFFVSVFVLRYIHLLWSIRGRIKIQGHLTWSFFVFAIPLVLHSLLAGLTDYVDGWLIKNYFDDAAFAIYRYGAREIPLNAILIGAVISGLIMQKSDTAESIKLEMKKVLKTLVPILAVLMLLSPLLFQWIYSEDYLRSALYFNIYAFLILSHAIFVQVYFYKNEDRWLLTWISLAEVVANVLLSLFLLHRIGILGIPIATVVVDVIFRLIMMALVRSALWCTGGGILSDENAYG